MEIRAGFEPAINSFADCPLEPLEYRIMAGIAGFEPAVPVSKTGALTPWLYPIVMVIRAGLEPSITALKGLCPDRLDERTRAESQREYFKSLITQVEQYYTPGMKNDELIAKIDVSKYIDHRPRLAWIIAVNGMAGQLRKKK